MVGLIILFPLIYSIQLAVSKVGLREMLTGERPFVGINNFIEVFTESMFQTSFIQTTYFTIVVVVLEVLLGLFIALILKQNFWGKPVLLAVILAPWAVPPVVNGVMWRFFFNSEFGWVNGFLYDVGIINQYMSLLSNPGIALYLVAFAYVWRTVPFSTLIFYAGVKSIPEELYEAARVDGANTWQRFLRITWPLLKPALLVLLVMRTMFALRVFDEVFAMTYGGPSNSTWTIGFFIYKTAFEFLHLGEASAAALFLGIFTAILALIYIWMFYTEVEF